MHLTAKLEFGREPLDVESRHELWQRLRSRYADVAAACLMPEHLHALAPTKDPSRERARLAYVLGAAFRGQGPELWRRIPEPTVIRDRQHLYRQIRYVHLNPTRAGLVGDPLEWPWSTHRGVVGAEVDPWVTADSLARRLGEQRVGFEQRFHEHVSGDPSAAVGSTPFPVPAPARIVAAEPLAAIRRAALAATPWSLESERRRTLVVLAVHQGWSDPEAIAELCGISQRSVRRLRASDPPHPAALLCLGDTRLQRGARPLRPLGSQRPGAL